MKIDKTKPSHWLLLGLFTINVVIAMLWRPFYGRSRKKTTTVVLYGHKLNSNLLAIYRFLRATHREAIEPVFLTMDLAYYRRLRANGDSACLAIAPACASVLARADAVISDHGLHSLQIMLGRSNIRFFDVWHGIPFKGFDAEDFRIQHRYDETWVPSPLLADLYTQRFGFAPEQVKIPAMHARMHWLPARIRWRNSPTPRSWSYYWSKISTICADLEAGCPAA